MTDQELKDLVASLAIAQAKTDKQLAKTDKQLAETDKQIRTSQAKTDKQLAEFTKGLNDLKKLFGSAQNNQGQINEEFICNSIIAQDQATNGKVLWGVCYDYIERNVKSRFGQTQGEYDCVAYNGDSIAIVEVKSKAHINDIAKFPTMIRTFRILYPMYKDFKIYIGIASLHINNDVVKECQDKGYGILRLSGNTLEELASKLIAQ